MYLAASGVQADVLDFDVVELSNLHRQIIHDESKTGVLKAVSAVERMRSINSSVVFNSITDKLTTDNAFDIIKGYDLVVDATDNVEVRYVINDCCVLLGKPFISGSAITLEGQITVVVPSQTPCYRCTFPQPPPAASCLSCADAGVLGPIPGLIGCLQAIETIKILLNKELYTADATLYTNISETPALNNNISETPILNSKNNSKSHSKPMMQPLLGKQVFYDAISGEFYNFKLASRRLDCAVCGNTPTIKSMKDTKLFLATGKTTVSSVCPTQEEEDTANIDSCLTNNSLVNISNKQPAINSISVTKYNELLKSSSPSLLSISLQASIPSSSIPVVHNTNTSIFVNSDNDKNDCNPSSLPFPHYSLYQQHQQLSRPHLLLDVRSPEQFSITHLTESNIITFNDIDSCLAVLLDGKYTTKSVVTKNSDCDDVFHPPVSPCTLSCTVSNDTHNLLSTANETTDRNSRNNSDYNNNINFDDYNATELQSVNPETTSASSLPVDIKAVQINVPLDVLKGGKLAANRERNQQKVMKQLVMIRDNIDILVEKIAAALTSNYGSDVDNTIYSNAVALERQSQNIEPTTELSLVSSSSSTTEVYVLCRRGIASVAATKILMQFTEFNGRNSNNKDEEGAVVTLYNIEGGLTAWSEQIDKGFAMY